MVDRGKKPDPLYRLIDADEIPGAIVVSHESRTRRFVEPDLTDAALAKLICAEDECENPTTGKTGYCGKHWQQAAWHANELPESVLDDMRREYEVERLSGPEIAAKLGLTAQSVYYRLHRAGVKIDQGGRSIMGSRKNRPRVKGRLVKCKARGEDFCPHGNLERWVGGSKTTLFLSSTCWGRYRARYAWTSLVPITLLRKWGHSEKSLALWKPRIEECDGDVRRRIKLFWAPRPGRPRSDTRHDYSDVLDRIRREYESTHATERELMSLTGESKRTVRTALGRPV